MSLRRSWRRVAIASTLVMGLGGCFGTTGAIYTPREAGAATGSLVRGFGNVACQFIEDYRSRRACFDAARAAARAAAADASARAATTGYCIENDRLTRTASRDNLQGVIVTDRTGQQRVIWCTRRLQNHSGTGVQPIF